MSKEKRFIIQVDPLEMEDDAIFDNKELRLYECQSDMMSDICSLLNKQDQRIAELEEQLKNATKQVRKEVVQEIREKAYDLFCDDTISWYTREEMFLEYLNQTQGEIK